MGEFGPWHLLIVAAVFVMLFGAKRLPEAARSLGRSARIMKTELKSMHDEDDAVPAQLAAPVVAPVVAPVTAPTAASVTVPVMTASVPAVHEPAHIS
jgi:sec-independent protein translocase protein TatA